jgi:hypothetical protein
MLFKIIGNMINGRREGREGKGWVEYAAGRAEGGGKGR